MSSARAFVAKSAAKYAARAAWKRGRRIVLTNPNDGVTYADFSRTGWQDCDNVLDYSEFDIRGGLTPKQIVAATFERWEEDGDLERFFIEDWAGDFGDLDPHRAYVAWKREWMRCAEGHITRRQEDNMRRHNPRSLEKYLVLRVDRDNSDTYAHELDEGQGINESIDDLLDTALPDRGSTVEYGIVEARDAGAARLMRPTWKRVDAHQMRYWRGRQFSPSIRDGMARAMWVTSYADWVEEQPRAVQKRLGPGAGGEWNDAAPATPESADEAAMELYEEFERVNGCPMGELLDRAMEADDLEADDEIADAFGHGLAMQAMGHGVSWFDDHAQFELKFPRRVEAHTVDGKTMEWSPRMFAAYGKNPARK